MAASTKSAREIRLELLDGNDAWMLDQIVVKGQLENGSHPERYVKYRFKRARPYKRHRKLRALTSVIPSVVPSGKVFIRRYNPNQKPVVFQRMTEARVRQELEKIFHIRERLEELQRGLNIKDPRKFLRTGWQGMYYPSGYHSPITPRAHRVPYGYFTAFEQEILAKHEAEKNTKPRLQLFVKHKFWKERLFMKYWIREYFPPMRWIAPITFARISDFNEKEEVDPSRKNYDYPRLRKGEPRTKIKLPSLYDGSTHCLLTKYLNLRRYHLHYGDKYRYKPTYQIDRSVYTRWNTKPIEILRRYFQVFDPLLTGFITFEEMCEILDAFGDQNSGDVRRAEFDFFADPSGESQLTPHDQIEFEEFLRVFYILKYGLSLEAGPKLVMGVRRKTPYDHPLADIHHMGVSFRMGEQGPSIAVGSSTYWNLAVGMF